MTSEEIDVWAWTSDYDLIIVEGSDMEPLYGIQNRHTLVIEVQEPVFATAIGYLLDLQDSYDAVAPLIQEDGSVSEGDVIKVTYKPKTEEYH